MGLEQTQDAHKIDSFVTTLLDTNKSLEDRIANLEANEGVAIPVAIFPERATLWHDESIMVVGTKTITGNTNQLYNAYFRTGTNGASWTNSFLLKAGTYSLTTFGLRDTDCGIVSWYLDDVLVASHDLYNGALVYNQYVTTSSIAVATSGRHILRAVVNTKNASSSNYVTLITKVYIYPTADSIELVS